MCVSIVGIGIEKSTQTRKLAKCNHSSTCFPQSLCRGMVKQHLITGMHVFVCMEMCHEIDGDTYLCL